MSKLKVAVLNGPKEILEFLGDDIQEVDINSAELVIMAGDKDISPEYNYQTTKYEKRHDPVKDYKMILELKKLHANNPRAYVVGLRNDATFIDVIRGGKLVQKQINGESKEIELRSHNSNSHFFCGNTKFTVPNFKTYYTRSNGNKLLFTGNDDEFPMISEYYSSMSYNAMISIHIDPLLMDKNDVRNKIIRCYIKKRFTNPYAENGRFTVKAEECNPSSLSDVSIWSCTSDNPKLRAELTQRACFGHMVKLNLSAIAHYDQKAKVTWKVRVIKPSAWYGKYGRCVTFFKPEEYKEYYDRLAQIYNFEYNIVDNSDDYFTIFLTIDACCAWHKIILTQIRYIYQYCMHYILFDALKLKAMDDYKDMDIMDLINIVAKSCSHIMYESNEYMLLGYNEGDYQRNILRPFKDEEFRATVDSFCKNNEYPSINNIAEACLIKCPDGFKYIDNDLPFTCSWIVFTETFGRRFNTYQHNINVFKSLLK